MIPEIINKAPREIRLLTAVQAAGRPFDAVIMDLTIKGGMGGKDAMARLKEIDPAAKALVSSGYSESPVVAEFRAHGFSGTLPKPYTREQMSAALHALLG